MRVGSSEPHGEPECAKFGRVGCSSRQRHKLHQPLRCNVLVPNGSCHYLSDTWHILIRKKLRWPVNFVCKVFLGIYIEWFSVKAANPVFFVRSYGIDRNNSLTVIEALELITNYC
ncbi:hypothetical protein ALC60_13880 [Trachymyrmex zeteki]|uniref:Uncharacterized protein n=1 Tax=Mycetomoellerius zeteki TaxID=64791 RepID=A0A151WH33_9HYME|nr:hypothetical protein ALC60_13880 [Trachymyrmex zeteki]